MVSCGRCPEHRQGRPRASPGAVKSPRPLAECAYDRNQFLGELTSSTHGMGAAWAGPAGEHIEADGQMKDSEPPIRFCRILKDFCRLLKDSEGF